MRKRRERLGIVLVIVLVAAFLSSAALAVQVSVMAVVRINTGKLLLITSEGKKIFYEQGEKDLLLTPQARIISMEGTSVIEVEDAQLILDKGDELAYESEIDKEFRCLAGSIEAVSGNRTYKLRQGEVVALNSPSGKNYLQGVAVSRAKSLERVQRFSGPVVGPTGINPPIGAPNGVYPYQGGPYIPTVRPWMSWYADSSQWASPYW